MPKPDVQQTFHLSGISQRTLTTDTLPRELTRQPLEVQRVTFNGYRSRKLEVER